MKKGTKRMMSDNPNKVVYGKWKADESENDTHGDSGGASRFFYVAKASRAERSKGLEGIKYELKDKVPQNDIKEIRKILSFNE